MATAAEPSVKVKKLLTADEVGQMLEDGRLDPDMAFELIDGEVVELAPVFSIYGRVSARILVAVGKFADQAGGEYFDAQAGFMVSASGRDLRAPDVSYIGPKRSMKIGRNWGDGAPDLAVEVLSESQGGLTYARRKVREYLDAGGQLVWLVNVERREVRVYRKGEDSFTICRDDAVLTLDPIVGGFRLPVADIFAGI